MPNPLRPVYPTFRPPSHCPVCSDGKQDAESVKLHNEIASRIGCRVYPSKEFTK